MQRFGKYLGRADADLGETAHVGSGVKGGHDIDADVRIRQCVPDDPEWADGWTIH
jgi:hypothetical protein